MKFISIEYKNFWAVGNTAIKIDLDQYPTTILSGKNGSGKCLDKRTEIDISFENDEVRQKFIEFMSK